ncbi:MAG: phage replisome organizer N-terminal domain-containing protein [Oscillospiraceae bacterium]|nr:phage replisome organizer N-terminal domain-containing protein [Oscillospiraceae bacterium]
MADVKWIKIVTDIFDDEKILLIESMPEADSIIVIWFKLLCLAGRQNNSGVFLMNGRIPYTDEMFATIFRRKLNTVRLALKTFEQYGMIEIINDTVTIPNWGKHQTLDQIERKREYMKNYMQKRREEQRLLAEGEVNCKTNSTVNGKANDKANVSRADKIREDEIREDKNREGEEPKRKRFTAPTVDEVEAYAKEKGYTGFSAELVGQIIEDVKRRCATEWKGADMQYIPHPATYINQRRWEDETPPQARQGKQQGDRSDRQNPALDYAQRKYSDDDYGDDFFIDLEA